MFTNAYHELMELLNDIENNEAEKPENRRRAAGLRKFLGNLTLNLGKVCRKPVEFQN